VSRSNENYIFGETYTTECGWEGCKKLFTWTYTAHKPELFCCRECGNINWYDITRKILGSECIMTIPQMREIVARYKDGQSTERIALDMNIRYHQLCKFLFNKVTMDRHQIVHRQANRPTFSEEECKAIYDKRMAGTRRLYLAAEYNTSMTTIDGIIRKMKRRFRAAATPIEAIVMENKGVFSKLLSLLGR